MKNDLIDLQNLRIEPIGEFNPCYGDNFVNLDNWSSSGGSVEIENDSVKLITVGAKVNLINNNLENISDSVIEVSGKILRNDIQGFFGIIFSYVDNDNFWRISVRSNSSNMGGIWVYQTTNGVMSLKFKSGYLIIPDQWTNLKLDWINKTIKIYLNNVLITEYTHNDIINGKVGLIAYRLNGQEVYLDDFLIGQGVYNSYLYNSFTEYPLISKINNSTSIDMTKGRVLSLSDKKLRLKILNVGANNTFKIKSVYKPIKVFKG